MPDVCRQKAISLTGTQECQAPAELVSMRVAETKEGHVPAGGHPAAAEACGRGRRGLCGGRRQHPGHDVRHNGAHLLEACQARITMLSAVHMMSMSLQ